MKTRPLTVFVAAQGVSTFGDKALWLAMGLQVESTTHSASAAGLVWFMYLLGTLTAPLSGALVDRVERRALLLWGTSGTALGTLLFLLVGSADRLWLLYVLMVAYGAASSLLNAARSALLVEMATPDELPGANAAFVTLQQGVNVLAPVAGAGMLTLAGAPLLVVVDASTFVPIIVYLLTMRHDPRAPDRDREPRATALLSGFRYLWHTPSLRRLSTALLISLIGYGTFYSVAFVITQQGLGRDAGFVGVLYTLQAVGAIGGGICVRPLLRRMGDLQLAALGLVAGAVGLGLMALPLPIIVLLAQVAFGFGVTFLLVGAKTAVQSQTPDRLQGRVAAAFGLVVGVPQTLGVPLGGWLLTVADYRTVLAVAAAGVALASFPALHQPRQPRPVRAPAQPGASRTWRGRPSTARDNAIGHVHSTGRQAMTKTLADAPFLDPTDAGYQADPVGFVRSAARHDWLMRTPRGGLVVGPAQCRRLLADRDLVSPGSRRLRLAGVDSDLVTAYVERSLVALSGDAHRHIKRAVGPVFSRAGVDRMRPMIRRHARALIEPLVSEGRTEFMADVANYLPLRVMCELVGAPIEDGPDLAAWSTAANHAFTPLVAEHVRDAEDGIRNVLDYVGELVEDRRVRPRNDLVSVLARTDAALTDFDVATLIANIIVAGYDTTRCQLGIAMWLLAIDRRDTWAALRREPCLIPGTVSELLRLRGAVRTVPRYVLAPMFVDGYSLHAGTLLGISTVAGNTAATEYPNPDEIDARRRGPRHLSFGGGMHFCLGASLAAAEIEETISVLSEAVTAIRLSDGVVAREPLGLDGFESLPLRLLPH